MPIEDCDYFIRIVRFPVPVPGFVTINSDGTYSMYLNAELFFEQRLDAYEHELWHIISDDLYGDKDIRNIEDL